VNCPPGLRSLIRVGLVRGRVGDWEGQFHPLLVVKWVGKRVGEVRGVIEEVLVLVK